VRVPLTKQGKYMQLTGLEGIRLYTDAERARAMEGYSFREEDCMRAERVRLRAANDARRLELHRIRKVAEKEGEEFDGTFRERGVLETMDASEVIAPRPAEEAPAIKVVATPAVVRAATTCIPLGKTSALAAVDFAAPRPPPSKELGFPVQDLSKLPEFDNPLGKLNVICRDLFTHKDYSSVRSSYCQASIHMNLLGLLAPAFRPKVKAHAPKNDPIHMLLHRDQLVIDYHWCYAQRMQLSPKDDAHAMLMNEDMDFDFAVALKLSAKKHKSIFRAAEALCLTPFQQCQTMKLHSLELDALLKSIGGGWRESGGKSSSKLALVKREIGRWVERNKRIAPERSSYECLWLARQTLGPDTPNQQIADLHALMVGFAPLDRTTIRDKLKLLDKHVRVA
jgi:hypothetical protein